MAAPLTPMRAPSAPRTTAEQVQEHRIATDTLTWLSGLIALLALAATLVGLFWQEGSGQFSFRTVRGETVQLFGQGIYRYDTLFQGAINRGTDAVTLVLGIPLLVFALLLYRRGSLRGRLLLSGMLAFPLLGILVLLAPCIIAATVSQLAAGVSLTPVEVIGPVIGFTILGVVAIRLIWTVLRAIPDASPPLETGERPYSL